MILIKIPNPEKVPKMWTNFEISGLQSKNNLLVNGMSYFEIETQLLTFRQDIQPYEFVYHLIFENRNENNKVVGGDWCVKEVA